MAFDGILPSLSNTTPQTIHQMAFDGILPSLSNTTPQTIHQMAFAGIVPSWACQGPPGSDPKNWTVKSCHVTVNATSGHQDDCLAYNFSGNRHTAIAEVMVFLVARLFVCPSGCCCFIAVWHSVPVWWHDCTAHVSVVLCFYTLQYISYSSTILSYHVLRYLRLYKI